MIILRFPTALTGSSCLAAVGTPAAPNIMITAASVQDEQVAAGRATQVPAARSTQRDRLPAAAARRPRSVELGYFGDTFGRPSADQLPWGEADPNSDMFAKPDESREFITGTSLADAETGFEQEYGPPAAVLCYCTRPESWAHFFELFS
jgi:hypothetical protein